MSDFLDAYLAVTIVICMLLFSFFTIFVAMGLLIIGGTLLIPWAIIVGLTEGWGEVKKSWTKQ